MIVERGEWNKNYNLISSSSWLLAFVTVFNLRFSLLEMKTGGLIDLLRIIVSPSLRLILPGMHVNIASFAC